MGPVSPVGIVLPVVMLGGLTLGGFRVVARKRMERAALGRESWAFRGDV